MNGKKITRPKPANLEREEWRRFRIKNPELLSEAKRILESHHLTRRETAIILEALAVQSEFSCRDFDK